MAEPRELTDDYRLDKRLGSSRGASILRAISLASGQSVVIKLINVPAQTSPARAAMVVERFVEHATKLRLLRHRNLPLVLDFGMTPEGGAFLVMEELEGVGFTSHVAAEGATPELVLPLLVQALDGLEELAGHGLAHLNVAPDNLFLVTGPSGAPGLPATLTVKLLGLCTPLFHLGESHTDAESARFRAPELALPALATLPGLPALVDWHADCYSLALVACNALGATVALGEASGTIVQMPLALSFELANDEALRQILEGCLRRMPTQRPAHGAIREAFSLALGGAADPEGRPAAAEDWRSALGRTEVPLPPVPSWQSAAAREPFPERPRPLQELAELPVSGLPARAGDGSFFDPFEIPGTLPDLDEEPQIPGALPDLDEAPVGTGLREDAAPSAAEMAAALGLAIKDAPEAPEASLPAAVPQEATIWPPEAHLSPPSPATDVAAPAWTPAAALAMPKAAWTPPVSPAIPAAAGFPAIPDAGREARTTSPPPPAVAPAAAAPAAARLPAPPPPPDSPPGEMLSAVDDLLGSLPPLPPPEAAAVTAPPHRSGSDPTPKASAPGRSAAPVDAKTRALEMLRGLPRPVLLAAAGALALAIVALAAWLLFGRGSRGGPQAANIGGVAGGDPASPPPKPGRSPEAKLFEAKSYLIMGKDSDPRVRQGLRELSFADQGALGPVGCRQLAAIQQTLALTALQSVPQDLASGLHNGDLGLLESVVEVASDRDVPPGQKGDLDRARNLVKQYQLAQAASSRGDHAEVLERCRAMEGLTHSLRDPLALREKTAAAIEGEAAAVARDGRYAEALGQLEPIRRTWPERGGIKELVKTYETAAANEQAQLAILETVPNILRRRKPSEGLDALRPLKPTPHLEARIKDAIQQLESQLAQLDAQPPRVVLRDGYVLSYSRGQVVILSFRVTDDYQVKSVKMYARPESGRLREVQLQKSGFGYTVEMPPSFHQNGTVDFYVVATDLSGHEGYLGTKEQPKQIKRRQGFERLLR